MAGRTKQIWMRLGLLLVCSLLLAGPMSCSRARKSGAPDPAGQSLREFVGGPARLVWIQQVDGDGDDPFCDGSRLILMGLDTEDGRGPRPIVNTVTNYHRPMLTPDGRHVVYSRQTTREAFAVAWDGGRPRRLGAGYAAATWQDPATGAVWVYMADNGTSGKERNHAKTLHRVRLDDPSVQEVVWDLAKFTFNSLQLSADGAGLRPVHPSPRRLRGTAQSLLDLSGARVLDVHRPRQQLSRLDIRQPAPQPHLPRSDRKHVLERPHRVPPK